MSWNRSRSGASKRSATLSGTMTTKRCGAGAGSPMLSSVAPSLRLTPATTPSTRSRCPTLSTASLQLMVSSSPPGAADMYASAGGDVDSTGSSRALHPATGERASHHDGDDAPSAVAARLRILRRLLTGISLPS